ncbi:hypothetical protein V5O48_010003, partial [Marasmius crinis-equi]
AKEVRPAVTSETCKNSSNVMKTPVPYSLEPRLRRLDYIPSHTEQSQLLHVIRVESQHLELCKADLAALLKEQKLLEERIRSHETSVARARAPLSVQRQVPIEVWESIFFIYCSSIHDYSFSYPGHRLRKSLKRAPALIISQICSRWRVIAQASPRLWSSIDIDVQNVRSNIVVPLQLYLDNAKDYPLRIGLQRGAPPSDTPPLPEHGRAAWNTLAPYLSRCRELTLCAFHLDFMGSEGVSFPKLETFYERIGWGFTGREDTLWFWRAIKDAPKPATVITTQLHDMLPFSRLTSLDVKRVGLHSAQRLLAALPSYTQLEHLTIRTFKEEPSIQSSTVMMPVRAPSLRKLSLGRDQHDDDGPDQDVINILFSFLSMPNLRSLDLRCDEQWPSALPTLARLSPLLERVTISVHLSVLTEVIDPSTLSLRDLFQNLPHVTHLELYLGTEKLLCDPDTVPDGEEVARPLYGNGVLSEVLSHLIVKPDCPILLSKLEYLSLRLFPISLDSEVVDVVEDLVASRHVASNVMKDFLLFRSLEEYLVIRGVRESLKPVFLDHSLAARIKECEQKFGIRVVISGSDVPPAVDLSTVMQRLYSE